MIRIVWGYVETIGLWLAILGGGMMIGAAMAVVGLYMLARLAIK